MDHDRSVLQPQHHCALKLHHHPSPPTTLLNKTSTPCTRKTEVYGIKTVRELGQPQYTSSIISILDICTHFIFKITKGMGTVIISTLCMRKLRHGIDCLTHLTKHAAHQVKLRFRLFGSTAVSYTDTPSSCCRQY